MMRWLYHIALAVPHEDKRKMEDLYRGDAESADSLFRNVIGIRPTLLAGKADYRDAAGLAKVKYGFEDKPQMGYTIKRADVGHWVFENVISETSRRAEIEGQMVSLAT
jgi:hypothetical protein